MMFDTWIFLCLASVSSCFVSTDMIGIIIVALFEVGLKAITQSRIMLLYVVQCDLIIDN